MTEQEIIKLFEAHQGPVRVKYKGPELEKPVDAIVTNVRIATVTLTLDELPGTIEVPLRYIE
jgi:hypothetical protein